MKMKRVLPPPQRKKKKKKKLKTILTPGNFKNSFKKYFHLKVDKKGFGNWKK